MIEAGRTKRRSIPWTALAAFLLLMAAASGQEVRLIGAQCAVDPEEAVLGEEITYLVKVRIAMDESDREVETPRPVPPTSSDFEIRYRDQSQSTNQSTTIINGRVSSEYSVDTTFLFTLVPKGEGRFTIPAFDYEAFGKKARLRSCSLTVAKEAPGNRYVSLIVRSDKPNPYVNEPVTLSYELRCEKPVLSRSASLEIPWVTVPNGFAAGPVRAFRSPTAVTLNGEPAQVDVAANPDARDGQILRFERVLYPIAPGRVELGGTRTRVEMALEWRRAIFGDQVTRSTKAVIVSDPLTLDVRDAPAEGRPASYSGAVGDFEVEARYGDGHIRAGDGVTLKLVITGKGALDSLPLPVIENRPDLDVYSPDRRTEDLPDERKTHTISWLMVPRQTTLKELPRFEFSWFSPSKGRFETVATGPMPLEIRGEVSDARIFEGSLTPKKAAEIRILGEGIRPIREKPGDLGSGPPRVSIPILLFVGLAPWVSFAILSFVVARRRRLSGDVLYQRKRRASKEATQRLEEARALLSAPKGFHGRLSRSLAGFVGDKLGVPPASVTAATLPELARSGGLAEATAREIAELLDHLDTREFGGGGGDAGERAAELGRVEKLIERVDREVRR